MVTNGQLSPGSGLNGCLETKHAYKAHFLLSKIFFYIFSYSRPLVAKSQFLGTYYYSSISPRPDGHFDTKYAQIAQFFSTKNECISYNLKYTPFCFFWGGRDFNAHHILLCIFSERSRPPLSHIKFSFFTKSMNVIPLKHKKTEFSI